MFFELRQYHIRPGMQAQWVKCMEEEIIPFQVNEISPRVGTMIDREQIKVQRIVATPHSVIQ